MQQRIKQVRKDLASQQLDALFITNQHNVTYLTGFSGLSTNEREGFLWVSKKSACLYTFSTYFAMYKKGGAGFSCSCITFEKRLHQHIAEIINTERVKTIGYEEENISVAELTSIQKKTPGKWKATKGIVETLRLTKDEKELSAIAKAATITDEAYSFIIEKIKKGMSERTIALELEYYIKSQAQNIAFPPIVACGANAAIPHYMPSNDKKLSTNDVVLLDFGAKVDNYCSDMTRVVFLGKPSSRQTDIYHTVLMAQKDALEAIRPGKRAQDVDRVARDYIRERNYTPFEHGLGHGVGLAIHEAPKLRPAIDDILQENMVTTVEPGIYIPGYCGIRIEDLVVLKKEGVDVLSKSPKDLTIL